MQIISVHPLAVSECLKILVPEAIEKVGELGYVGRFKKFYCYHGDFPIAMPIFDLQLLLLTRCH